MTDLPTELRIIARDGGRLSQADRAAIAQAAEEFETTMHRAMACEAALIEANAHRLALTEQIAHLRKAQALPDLQPWSYSTGWIAVQVA